MLKSNCSKVAKFVLILLVAPLVFVAHFTLQKAYAQTSSTINFQGKIVRNDTGYEGLNVTTGNPACVKSGPDECDFQVKYYSASTSGTLYFTETYTDVEIGQYGGIFNLSLGAGTPTTGAYSSLDAMIKAQDSVYVEILFSPAGTSSFTETFSRMPLQASAYAIKSKYAEYAKMASGAFKFENAANSTGYSGSDGMVYYDTTAGVLKLYSGGVWQNLATGGSSIWGSNSISSYSHYPSQFMETSGIATLSNFGVDATVNRAWVHGASSRTGFSVYSNYSGATDWPLVTFKADASNFGNSILQLTQDGTGNILEGFSGSTPVFNFDKRGDLHLSNNGVNYFGRFPAPPTTGDLFPGSGEGCLYNVAGTLYWDGACNYSGVPINTGSSSKWTDAGTFTHLTSVTDDLILGANTVAGATFVFDMDASGGNYFEVDNADNSSRLFTIAANGNIGIGVSSPTSKLDIGGASSVISNTTGNITIAPSGNTIFSSGNVGIGTNNPGARIHIVGLVYDTSPFILASDSSGPSELFRIHSDGYSNFFAGNQAGASNEFNIIYSGGSNTFVGAFSGSANTSGAYNTALGSDSFRTNTTGTSNTAVGSSSLTSNTTGYNNTSIGSAAMRDNTTGGENVAVGERAFYSNISGAYNTVIGNRALSGHIAGSFNVAMGYDAGLFYGTGTGLSTNNAQSVFIGSGTRPLSHSETNQIVIGYNALGNGSNSVTLGNDSITKTILKGNVGIGTTSTPDALSISGSSSLGVRAAVTNTNASGFAEMATFNNASAKGSVFKVGSSYPGYKTVQANDFGIYNTTSGNMSFLNDYASGNINFAAGAASTPQVVITSSGNVGIGTYSPVKTLEIAGNMKMYYTNTGTSSTNIFDTTYTQSVAAPAGTIYGYYNKANYTATGTMLEMGAAKYDAQNDSTGTVTRLYTLDANVFNKTTGTVTTAAAIHARGFQEAYAGTISALHGVLIDNAHKGAGGTITRQSGLTVAGLTTGTYNTHLLLGTTSIPSGNYSIYSSSTNESYFSGILTIGGTGSSSGLRLQGGNTKIYTDASNGAIRLVPGNGWLSIRDGTDTYDNLLVSSTYTRVREKLAVGFAATPTVSVAVGDSDTGLNWISDGVIALYSNNAEKARFDSNTASFSTDVKSSYYFTSRHTSPTMIFQDSDNRSAMVHVNSNRLYVLRGSGTDSTTWSQYDGQWPLQINLENNDAIFGGRIISKYAVEPQLFVNLANTTFPTSVGISAGVTTVVSGKPSYTTSILMSHQGNRGFEFAGSFATSSVFYGKTKWDNGGWNAWVQFTTTAWSDQNLKTNIVPIDDALSKIDLLTGYYFDWKVDEYPGFGFDNQRQIGLIAQEVEQVFPQLVTTDPNGVKTLEYRTLVALLLQGIKQQQGMINVLGTRVSALDGDYAPLLTPTAKITTSGWYRISQLNGTDDYAKIKVNNSTLGSSQNLILSVDTVGGNNNVNVISNFTTGENNISKARINTVNGIKYLEVYLDTVNNNSIKVSIENGNITNWTITNIAKVDNGVGIKEYALEGVLFGVSDAFSVKKDSITTSGTLLTSSLTSNIGNSSNRWNDIYTKGTIRLGSGSSEGGIRYNVEKKRLEFSNDGAIWVEMGDLTSSVVISPEYSGAILYADGTDNYGRMTSDAIETGGVFKNYYEWKSDRETLQDYDILVRITLPTDFVSWKDDAISLDFMTENSASVANNKVDIALMGNSGIDGEVKDGISKLPGSWERVSIKSTNITQCKKAGDSCTVRLSMHSRENYFVRVGDISLNYNRGL